MKFLNLVILFIQKIFKKVFNRNLLIKMIDKILPRIQIYSSKMFKKIDIFEEAIEKSNKKFVCITYPNVPLIKPKKRKLEFCKKSTNGRIRQ